ncbi:hypothetical protein NPIL_647111 [Nephila pilipes]|uniref:Uncharacterized protein n=1 Tax=Nephila pilipes TaxID=299642 RepID=A0A8X6JUR0_NEPPI|nr:hypothetical protein NPIL_647111 [Nephila pilipes]
MTDFMNFDDLFEEVDLPVPLSPLPPTPVSSPRPMSLMSPAESVAEIPELYFEKSVVPSLEPCSTEPRAASPRLGPSAVVSVVQWRTDPPRRKRSLSKEDKKSSKRSRSDEGKSSGRHISPDTRSQEARPHDPRSQEVRPWDFKIHPRHIPAFGRRFIPSSWEEARPQIFFHHHGMAVFNWLMVSRSRKASCPTLWTSGAISGISKQLTQPVLLETLHHRDAEPWERGDWSVSVLQSQQVSSLAGDTRHEHVTSLPHSSHSSHVSKVGNACPATSCLGQYKRTRGSGPFHESLFSSLTQWMPSQLLLRLPCLPDKTDVMEHVVRQGLVKAFITYQEPKNNRIFVSFSSPTWFQKKTFMDNFKRTIHEAQVENRFDPNAVQWEKISQALLRNPDRTLKNADKKMGFIFNNVFIVKCFFTLGLRKVELGMIHLIQTTNAPVFIYELPPSSQRSQAEPNLYRRSFEPYDQMLYHRTVMDSHTS